MKISKVFEQDFYSGLDDLPKVKADYHMPAGAFDFKPMKRVLKDKMKVSSLPNGKTKVGFSDAGAAMDFYNMVAGEYGMGDVALDFDPALLSYDPPEQLLKKSKNPLWVLKPLNNQTVIIQRTVGHN